MSHAHGLADFAVKPVTESEVQARIAELRAEHLPPALYRDPAETARAEQARIAECERRQARAEIEARLRKLPFSKLDPGAPPAVVAVAVQPKPVTTRPTTTPREPQPMTTAATAEPPPPPPTKPLTDRQREIIAVAERLDAAGVTPTCSALAREFGTTAPGIQSTIIKLRSRGHWRWDGVISRPRGRPPGPRLATATTPAPAPTAPPKPAPAPATPRSPAPTPDSTSVAPERVLGHPGGLPGQATKPESNPLVLELVKGTLSAALANLGPHLSDRNRLALEMCLEVLR